MSLLNIPSIQTPPGNPEFVNLESRYTCIVCNSVLRDAMQTTCGHRLCEGCIATLFEGKGDTVDCPANEEDCQQQTRNDITIDPGCRREVARLPVKCTFNKEGCVEKISWKNLEAHEPVCEYRLVSCHNMAAGCTLMIPQALMDHHVKFECNFRLEQCEFCHQAVPKARLEHHQREECLAVQLSCPYNCGQPSMSRDELNNHRGICPNKPVECTYKSVGCGFVGTEEQVANHLLNDVNSHLEKVTVYTASMEVQSLEIRRELQAVTADRDRFQRQVQEQQTVMSQLQQSMERYVATNKDLRIKMVSLTERQIQMERKVMDGAKKDLVERNDRDIKAMQTSLTQVRSQVSQLEARNNGGQGGQGGATSSAEVAEVKRLVDLHQDQFGNIDRQMAELDLRFQIMETASFDGQLLWKLRDYSRRKREAVQGRTLSLYSQPFYTHRFGYKMCARIYLNGDGMGKGTHLSLFFVIMRGEYDNLLAWPFQQKVTMILMDQDNGQTHLSDTFRPDPSSSSFKKPASDMNIASGCPLFVSHTILETPKYVKDDTIFIKVVVDINNLSPP